METKLELLMGVSLGLLIMIITFVIVYKLGNRIFNKNK